MVGWNTRLVNVLVINKAKQNILCTVELNKIKFYCTIVYASNNGAERRDLWKELAMQKQFVKNDPWVILGDFNVTINASEHSSGSSGKTIDMAEFNDWSLIKSSSTVLLFMLVTMVLKEEIYGKNWLCKSSCKKSSLGDFNVTINASEHSSGSSGKTIDMAEFNDAINSLEVEEICSSGFQFTWTKSLKNPKCKILKKLDRILVNDEFMQKFQSAHGVFLPYMISYHSPAVLHIKNGVPKKKSSFRFNNFVVEKPEFLKLVDEAWREEMQGCYMYKIVKKLKKLKGPLKKLSWSKGNVFENVSKLKEKLSNVQAHVDKNPHDEKLKIEAVNTLNEFVEASKDELNMLQQKTKIKWLNEGDKNTAFFHGILKSRRSKSRVEVIKNEDGVSFEGEDVNIQFVKHFESFFGKVDNTSCINESMFKKKLSNEDARSMISEVTDKEIKEAMFDIDSNKASGPGGFTSEFFKRVWDIIGMEVCLAIKEFFYNGKLLGEVNSTLIALIPKVNSPSKISEFRPISCCNVIYKCISKILTNRIKSGLDKIVHINQSAFIPGRHIQDNILIAQELLRGYNRKNGSKRCAMQIDIQKAYDTVSWSFLEDTLGNFGFHRKMGDPMSPYLFTLVMEVLSLSMEKNIEDSNGFGYHFGCKELKLSHMCFADDLLVLCKGNKESIEVIKRSLEEFSKASGLVPNLGKSIIFFGSINERDKIDLLQVMPFKCGKLPVRYLGVPLLAKKLGVKDCKVLCDKVEERINTWRNKTLSYAGRIQLIASVLSSMQQYWASVYLLPNTVINDLEKLFKRFLWNAGDSARGKVRVAWKVVCRPKDQGGLGIKSLKK
ncbi:RNA-directed DNA polymerase, eukaryota, reverse transcriptase zinc-binding domain protein [Tanacetum coccineum]